MKALSFAYIFICSFICGLSINSQLNAQSSALPGFSISPYFNEQTKTVNFNPDVRVLINAPSVDSFKPDKPVKLILFGIPNTNTIEWTMGKKMLPGDNIRFDIQHIAAQMRFIRNSAPDYNFIIAYMETSQKSWPAWRRANIDNAKIINGIVDSLRAMFASYKTTLILSGHSGGGSLTFGYLNGVNVIPDYIERIAFMDSNYGYEEEHGPKLTAWLKSAPEHFLSVIAYNDSVALYKGKPDVSPTGGTWYRSRMMFRYFNNYFSFKASEDSEFVRYTSEEGKVKMVLRQNPLRIILHTKMVELNGFIHSILAGTPYEGKGYVYYGPRAYSDYIQENMPDEGIPDEKNIR